MATNTTVQWKGSWKVDEDVPRTVEFDRFGIAGATIALRGPYAQCIDKVASMTIHPDYSWLVRKSASVTREEADYGKVSVQYEGVPPETDEKFYSLKASLNSEPIQTHPNFSEFGVAANGVIIDADGKFQGWDPVINGEINPFAGIESWLVPSMVYEEKWVRGQSSSESREADNVGTVDTPPNSPARPIAGGRTYLLLGMDIQIVGLGSVMTRQWKLSGPRKWNETIYGK